MIRKAERTDLPELGALGALLWPHHSGEELTAEFEKIMSMGKSAFFLARSGGQTVGFAQCHWVTRSSNRMKAVSLVGGKRMYPLKCSYVQAHMCALTDMWPHV